MLWACHRPTADYYLVKQISLDAYRRFIDPCPIKLTSNGLRTHVGNVSERVGDFTSRWMSDLTSLAGSHLRHDPARNLDGVDCSTSGDDGLYEVRPYRVLGNIEQALNQELF